MKLRRHSERGYTMIELLCVMGIIGILAGLYIGAIAKAFIHITKFVSGH
jgi:prepilin-type N-terminal cleavage/methylation domain-containing protein